MADVEEYFAGKPETHQIYNAVADRIAALGPSQITVKSQISFGVNRKFAWFWLYNVTRKNPSGILHVMLAIDRKLDDAHVREVNQVGKSRWNHQIVIRALEDAQSEWLATLLRQAYAYGSRE